MEQSKQNSLPELLYKWIKQKLCVEILSLDLMFEADMFNLILNLKFTVSVWPCSLKLGFCLFEV